MSNDTTITQSHAHAAAIQAKSCLDTIADFLWNAGERKLALLAFEGRGIAHALEISIRE